MLRLQKVFVNHSPVILVTLLSIVRVKKSVEEAIHQSKGPFKLDTVHINSAIAFSEWPSVLVIDNKYKKGENEPKKSRFFIVNVNYITVFLNRKSSIGLRLN